MTSTHKRVLVRKLDRELLKGFVDPDHFGRAEFELLSETGQLIRLDLAQVKAVYFVSSFERAESVIERRTFSARPRTGGLWLRLRFRDNEVLEGIVPNNLLDLGGNGFTIVPPDGSATPLHVYVPRTALAQVQVLGVIGTHRRRAAPEPAQAEQIDLFGG